jgi:hypothetical protein
MLIGCTVMADSLPVGPPHYDLLSADVGFKGKIILLAELGFRRKADTGESGSLFTNRTRDIQGGGSSLETGLGL